MRSALYYPHTEIQSEGLLKTALLLWDQVYVIAPWENFIPNYASSDTREAFELIGKCHLPTRDEKEHAHELVQDFLKRPLPDAFLYEEKSSGLFQKNDYEISSEKLLRETWDLLRDRRIFPEGAYGGVRLTDQPWRILPSTLRCRFTWV